MKKAVFLIITSLAGVFLFGQDGIHFQSGDWEAILAKAKAEDKIIFMDAYAAWCGPCKMMTRNVFPEKAVGDFFNEEFINVKMDMEKGRGIALAEAFNVTAYPSLLFLNGSGQVVHRAVGYHNAPKLLQLGRVALDPERRFSSFETRYQAGNRDPDFLHDYAMASYETMSGNHIGLAEDYLATQEDWSTEKNMRFIFTLLQSTDSEMFDYLAEHREAFEEMFGSQAVISRVQNLIIDQAFAEHSGEAALAHVEKSFHRVYPEVADQLYALFRMNYFQYTGEVDQYAQATVHYFNNYPAENAAELNNAAWSFYELVEEEEMLRQALDWSRQSVEMDAQYYNYDTLAALYYKLGKKGKAKRAAKKAIELAVSSGEDYSSTSELLERINSL